MLGVGITVYGDFNCPYSALASWRLDRLDRLAAERGGAGFEFEFRAVEHDPDIPPDGRIPELDDEIDEVMGLVTPDDAGFTLHAPDVLPNTSTMCAAYASAPSAELRRALFDAVWRRGPRARAVEVDAAGSARKDEWQAAWDAFGDKKIVPLLVMDDGYVSRGLGALKRLTGP